METKTFLIVLGAIITFVVLGGIWLISNSISEQSKVQYESAMNQSKTQYNEAMDITTSKFNVQSNVSEIIHQYIFDNITDLKKGLDPIIAIIPNATQSHVDQQTHYNQSADLDEILNAMGNNSDIVEQNKQDHELLVSINKTLSGLINDIPPTLATR